MNRVDLALLSMFLLAVLFTLLRIWGLNHGWYDDDNEAPLAQQRALEPTGYGQQTGLFHRTLKQHYDIASAVLRARGQPRSPGKASRCSPASAASSATSTSSSMPALLRRRPADGLVVTLMDVWVLDSRWMSQMNTAAWVPVDHEPAPPQVIRLLRGVGRGPDRDEQVRAADARPARPAVRARTRVDTRSTSPLTAMKVRRRPGPAGRVPGGDGRGEQGPPVPQGLQRRRSRRSSEPPR
jgi:hypothetical protein